MFGIPGTVRRFLEKFGEDIDVIVFVVTGNDRVFLCYFLLFLHDFFGFLVVCHFFFCLFRNLSCPYVGILQTDF